MHNFKHHQTCLWAVGEAHQLPAVPKQPAFGAAGTKCTKSIHTRWWEEGTVGGSKQRTQAQMQMQHSSSLPARDQITNLGHTRDVWQIEIKAPGSTTKSARCNKTYATDLCHVVTCTQTRCQLQIEDHHMKHHMWTKKGQIIDFPRNVLFSSTLATWTWTLQ